MILNKKILTFLFLILGSFFTQAQTRKGNAEKIRAFKVAFLTEKLNLTEEEAQDFWPLYNVYDKKMMQLRREERYSIKKKIKDSGGLDSLSEKESRLFFDKIKSVAKLQYETKNDFYNKLPKVLPYKKILQLEIAEYEFHRKLIRKLKGDRKEYQKIKKGTN